MTSKAESVPETIIPNENPEEKEKDSDDEKEESYPDEDDYDSDYEWWGFEDVREVYELTLQGKGFVSLDDKGNKIWLCGFCRDKMLLENVCKVCPRDIDHEHCILHKACPSAE